MKIDLDTTFERAKTAVRQAGGIILRDWEKPRNVQYKGRIDLVTETDLAVETELKQSLASVLPEGDFLAEETEAANDPGEVTWIIDPLDGTTNFAHGFPFVAVSVALWVQGRVELGMVYLPVLGEFFWARHGYGAYLNETRISVSDTDALKQSLVATGFPYAIESHLDQVLENMRAMLSHAQGVRRPGSAAIDLAYTACGRYDGFYEATLKPWDTAAGWLLVEEAGGRVTQFDSSENYYPGAPTILASNGLIHEDMSSLLRTKETR